VINKRKEYREIEALHLWDKNPRGITKIGFKRLKKQILKLGQYKPLLITPDGIVIGGNMRLLTYQDLKISPLWVSIITFKKLGDTYVASIDGEIQNGVYKTIEQGMLEYALSDNDRAGYYEDEKLAELVIDFPELELKDYNVDLGKTLDLGELLDQFGPEVEEDKVPEIEEGDPESKLGEVYQLGRHRLMCGDATKIEDVEKLMDGNKADVVFTDPPYGMDLDTDYSQLNSNLEFVKDKHLKKKTGNKYDKVIGDDTDYDPQHLFDMFPNVKEMFLWGGDYYYKRLPDGGSWFVWDKRGSEQFDKMYGSSFELLWSKNKHKRDIIRKTWAGVFGTESEDVRGRIHPTQKPIAVSTWVLDRYSKNDWNIVDLFGGSGSTLIACEQTNRTCYMMELDPKYCDVIRKRYDNFDKRKRTT